MRRLALALFLCAGCASTQSTGPDIRIALTQENMPSNVYYFAGPVGLQYQVAITNPTNEPVTLTRLDLQSSGSGAYTVNTSGGFNLKVPPNSTVTQTMFAWGRARGGFLASGEPVTLRIAAVFNDASGKAFTRIAMENLPQM